eukprot:1196781-Amphidinium_carterae.1
MERVVVQAGSVSLGEKRCYTLGAAPSCDIRVEHPSVADCAKTSRICVCADCSKLAVSRLQMIRLFMLQSCCLWLLLRLLFCRIFMQ